MASHTNNMITLTDYIELVGVINAAVLIFHHTGIVSLVRGYHRLHDDGPHMVTDLNGEKQRLQWYNCI